MAVHLKDCPHSWQSHGPYQGGPERDILPRALGGGGGGDPEFRKILVNIINHGALCIPEPHLSEGSAHIISKADCGELAGSLSGGIGLNYIGHRSFVSRASVGDRKERYQRDMAELSRQKYLMGGQYSQLLHRPTKNRAHSCLGGLVK